jgi:hypothetical protein
LYGERLLALLLSLLDRLLEILLDIADLKLEMLDMCMYFNTLNHIFY